MRHQKFQYGIINFSKSLEFQYRCLFQFTTSMSENHPPPNNSAISMHTSAIKAVVIRPNGDVTILHLTRFTDQYILPTDPIFHDVPPTEISVQIELPLIVQRLNSREIVPGDASIRIVQRHSCKCGRVVDLRLWTGNGKLALY